MPEATAPETMAKAKSQYLQYCSGCHGSDVVSGGGVPDLRYRSSQYDLATFELFVLEGVLEDKGMVSFKHVLSDNDVRGIYNYVLQEAQVAHASDQPPSLLDKINYYLLDLLASYLVLAIDGSPLAAIPLLVIVCLLIMCIFIWRRSRSK
jgi:mono/diheme cytochrome c family protein